VGFPPMSLTTGMTLPSIQETIDTRCTLSKK
jgi:hypothetical protein